MAGEVVERKLESLRRCVLRIRDKCPPDLETLVEDIDLQDILTLNLTRAVRLCVDIATHLLILQPICSPAGSCPHHKPWVRPSTSWRNRESSPRIWLFV